MSGVWAHAYNYCKILNPKGVHLTLRVSNCVLNDDAFHIIHTPASTKQLIFIITIF